MKKDLKPCPFCGGDAFCMSRNTRYGTIAWVECGVCSAQTKIVNSDYSVDEDGFYKSWQFDRIASAWNIRVGERNV